MGLDPDDCMNKHPMSAVPILCVKGAKPKHTSKTTKTAPQNDCLNALINVVVFLFMHYTRVGKLTAPQV